MVTAAVGRYVDLSNAYLRKAQVHLAEGDLVQASEKGWGAAAVLVKACAESREHRHQSHRDLWRTMQRLVAESGDREMLQLFATAESLHANFYEDYLESSVIADFLDHVVLLRDKLEPLIEPAEPR